jgi:hypothetical protein
MRRFFGISLIVLAAFSSVSAGVSSKRKYVKATVVRVGPSTTFIKAGLTIAEVISVLGEPVAISARREEGTIITRYEFPRGEGRFIIAEFIQGALVYSKTEVRAQVAQLG